ncbi:MAG: ankyrin repeat domain-containing protein [Alphaproteobacteria bacterium]
MKKQYELALKFIENDNIREFEELLQQYPKLVNYSFNSDGSTLLHYASFLGKIEAVKLLVKYKANINAKNIKGETAIRYADLKNGHEVIFYLLEQYLDLRNIPSEMFENFIKIARKNFNKNPDPYIYLAFDEIGLNDVSIEKDENRRQTEDEQFREHIKKIEFENKIISKIQDGKGLKSLTFKELLYLHRKDILHTELSSFIQREKLFTDLIEKTLIEYARKYLETHFFINEVIPEETKVQILSYLSDEEAIKYVSERMQEEFFEQLKSNKLKPIQEIEDRLEQTEKNISKDIGFKRWALSFITNTSEYKEYNELKHYINTRKSVESGLENKVGKRIKAAVSELAKSDDPSWHMEGVLEKYKLTQYVWDEGDKVKDSFVSSAKDLREIDEYIQNLNWFKRGIYKITLGILNFKEISNNLIEEIIESNQYKTVLNNKIKEAAGYEHITVKYGKATYSNKKLAYANNNAYRKASWTEWLKSFVKKDVKSYEQYNYVKEHRKSTKKLENNLDNIVAKDCEKLLRISKERFPYGNKITSLPQTEYVKGKFHQFEAKLKYVDSSDLYYHPNAFECFAQLPFAICGKSLLDRRYKIAAKFIAEELKNDPTHQKLWKDKIFCEATETVWQTR